MAKNDVRFYVRVDDKYIETDLKNSHVKLKRSAKSTNDDVLKDTEETNKKISKSYKDNGSSVSDSFKGLAKDAADSCSAMGGSFSDLASQILSINPVVAGIGAAVVGICNKSVGAAVDMDQAMNQFIASTGKSSDEVERYQGVLEGIYANNYGEDFQDIADSMALVTKSMGDMSDDQLQSITESAYALQDVFGFDISESVRSAQMMVDQFGISGESAFNLIAQGAQAGLDKNGDFLDSINEYSVQFAQLGLDATDMFNIFNAGAQSGAISIDKVGDAVKELGITVKDGTATDALEALGLNAEETAAAFARGGKDAFYAFLDVNEALSALEDPLQQNTLGVQLYGSMWEDLGAEAVTALANYGDAFNEMTDTMGSIKEVKYDDLGSMFEELKRNVELLLLPLGDALMPLLGDLLDACKPLVDTLGDSLAPIFEKIGEILTILAEPLGTLIEFVGELIGPLLELVSACLDPLLNLFTQLMEPLMALLDGILEPLKELFSSLIEPLMNLVFTALQPLFDVFTALIEPLMTLIDAILTPLQELFSALAPVFETLFGAISPIISIFTELIDIVVNTLSPVITALADILGGVLGTAFDGLRGIIDSVMQVFQGIIDFITGVFTGNWEQAWDGIVSIFKGIINIIPTVVETIINTVIGIINGIISGINSLTGAIGIPAIPSIPNVSLPRLKIGLDYVPNDFFPAFLDEGERVLTKEQNVRFNALGGLPGLEAAMSGYGITGGCPSFAISLVGDVTMDGRRVGSVVLQNIDSVVRSNGG